MSFVVLVWWVVFATDGEDTSSSVFRGRLEAVKGFCMRLAVVFCAPDVFVRMATMVFHEMPGTNQTQPALQRGLIFFGRRKPFSFFVLLARNTLLRAKKLNVPYASFCCGVE